MPDGSSIVITSSTVSHFGMPSASIYAAGKAALNSLARTLAVELAPRCIRVNVVTPGPITTPIFGKMVMDQATLEDVAAGILAGAPLGRFGTPDEVAGAVMYLSSTSAAFGTRKELVIDGGMCQF